MRNKLPLTRTETQVASRMAKENRHSFEPLQLMGIVRPVRVFPKRWTYIEHHEFDSTLSPPCRCSVSSAVQSDVSFLFLLPLFLFTNSISSFARILTG